MSSTYLENVSMYCRFVDTLFARIHGVGMKAKGQFYSGDITLLLRVAFFGLSASRFG